MKVLVGAACRRLMIASFTSTPLHLTNNLKLTSPHQNSGIITIRSSRPRCLRKLPIKTDMAAEIGR